VPFTSRAVVLGAMAFLVAATPAMGADATAAAVSLTGGTLAIVGLALIAMGAIALARPRRAAPSDQPLPQDGAESATVDRPVPAARQQTAGAAAARQQALAYRGANMQVKPSDDDSASQPEPAHAGAGRSLLSASESEEVTRFLAHASPIAAGSDSLLSDRDAMAEQMLRALKAERARRGS